MSSNQGLPPVDRRAWIALSVSTMAALLTVIDVSIVNVAFPTIREGARCIGGGPLLGALRLLDSRRLVPPPGRSPRRPEGPAQAVPDRGGDLRGGVVPVRSRSHPRPVDRSTRPAGHRWIDPQPGFPGDGPTGLPGGTAFAGHRDMGRLGCPGCGHRPLGRRHHPRTLDLALGVPGERSDRVGHPDRHPEVRKGVQGSGCPGWLRPGRRPGWHHRRGHGAPGRGAGPGMGLRLWSDDRRRARRPDAPGGDAETVRHASEPAAGALAVPGSGPSGRQRWARPSSRLRSSP